MMLEQNRCSAAPFGAHIPVTNPYTNQTTCKFCGALYGPERKRRTNPRSIEAAASLDVVTLADREREIVTLIGERGGLTTDEVEEITGGLHQSVSATISRLYHDRRMLRPSGRTRKTRTGRRADVYEVGDPQAPDAPVQPKAGKPDSKRKARR